MNAYSSFDAQSLIGKELSSINIATNNIRLRLVEYPLTEDLKFKSTASVDIEYGYQITEQGRMLVISQDIGMERFRQEASTLIQFIEKTIRAASFSERGELDIDFGIGKQLRLLISPMGFDSFHIHHT